MYHVILLKSPTDFARARWEAAEDVVDHEGVAYSLRAGPRQPLPTDHAWTRWPCMRPMRSAKRNSRTGMPACGRRWKSCA